MSAYRFELQASAAQTDASGETVAFHVPTVTMLMVGVDLTAYSGAGGLTVFLQGSDNGGTTWYDLQHDGALYSSAVEAPGAAVGNTRDICDDADATKLGGHVAVYKHLPTDYIRLKWFKNGTSATFSVSAVGK